MNYTNPNTNSSVQQPPGTGEETIYTADRILEMLQNLQRTTCPYALFYADESLPAKEIPRHARRQLDYFDKTRLDCFLPSDEVSVYNATEVYHERTKAEKLLTNAEQRKKYDTAEHKQYPFNVNHHRQAMIIDQLTQMPQSDTVRRVYTGYADLRNKENRVRVLSDTIKHGGVSQYILEGVQFNNSSPQQNAQSARRYEAVFSLLKETQRDLDTHLKEYEAYMKRDFSTTYESAPGQELVCDILLEVDRIQPWLFMETETIGTYKDLVDFHRERYSAGVKTLCRHITSMKDCGCLTGAYICQLHRKSSTSVASPAPRQEAQVNHVHQVRDNIASNDADSPLLNHSFQAIAARVNEPRDPYHALNCKEGDSRITIQDSYKQCSQILDPANVAPKDVETATTSSYNLLKAFFYVGYPRERMLYAKSLEVGRSRNEYPFRINDGRDRQVMGMLNECIQTNTLQRKRDQASELIKRYRKVRMLEDNLRDVGCSIMHGGATAFVTAAKGKSLSAYRKNQQDKTSWVINLFTSMLDDLETSNKKLFTTLTKTDIIFSDPDVVELECKRINIWALGEREVLHWYRSQIEFHVARHMESVAKSLKKHIEQTPITYFLNAKPPSGAVGVEMNTCGCIPEIFLCEKHKSLGEYSISRRAAISQRIEADIARRRGTSPTTAPIAPAQAVAATQNTVPSPIANIDSRPQRRAHHRSDAAVHTSPGNSSSPGNVSANVSRPVTTPRNPHSRYIEEPLPLPGQPPKAVPGIKVQVKYRALKDLQVNDTRGNPWFLKENDEVEVVARSGVDLKVKKGNQEGYVAAEYLVGTERNGKAASDAEVDRRLLAAEVSRDYIPSTQFATPRPSGRPSGHTNSGHSSGSRPNVTIPPAIDLAPVPGRPSRHANSGHSSGSRPDVIIPPAIDLAPVPGRPSRHANSGHSSGLRPNVTRPQAIDSAPVPEAQRKRQKKKSPFRGLGNMFRGLRCGHPSNFQ